MSDRMMWCWRCRAHRVAVLRNLRDVLVYRCGTCRHWTKCPTCAGTVTPAHSCGAE